jgi:hypothetical protein
MGEGMGDGGEAAFGLRLAEARKKEPMSLPTSRC